MPSVPLSAARSEVAVYDLDRTLTDSGSWVPFLRFWVLRQAPWRALLLPMVAIGGLAHTLGWRTRGQMKSWSHRWLIGPRVPAAQLAAAADAFADGFVAAHALAPARAAIAADVLAGRSVVIASASHAFYVRAIAARLGVQHVVATQARRDGDCVLPGLEGDNCYGAAKAAALRRWLANNAVPGAVVHFTSDHHSDLPCFELALASGGRVMCANPSSQLRAIAAARGWPAVHWGRIRSSLLERA
ncbi:HAD-IB family phosphatase [Sandarakinorhabdus sp.]|uniref:HAD-IB family phosphatase n=1 Tax=Sandarakinorhabdus sp. TaxID=1916663 RepID=UPI0033425796